MNTLELSPEHRELLDVIGTGKLRSEVLRAAVKHGSMTPLAAGQLWLRHQDERLAARAESDAQIPSDRIRMWSVAKGVVVGALLGLGGGGAGLAVGPGKFPPEVIAAGIVLGAGSGGIIGLAIGQLKFINTELISIKEALIATDISHRQELLDLAATLPPSEVELIYAEAVTGLTFQPPATPK